MISSNSKTRSEQSALKLLLPHAGITLAVGLGLIYVIGALFLIGQFSEEGIGMLDALPLVPIEQILARGIGVSAQISLLLMVGSIAFPVVGFLLDRMFPLGPIFPHRESHRRRFAGLAALSLALLVLFTPPQVVPAFVVATVVGVGVLVLMGRNGYGLGVARLTAAIAIVSVGSITLILTAPVPLPEVRLTPANGAPKSTAKVGALISRTDSTWYLATNSDSIAAVSSVLVAEGKIFTKESSYGKTLAGTLLDQF